MTNKTYSGESLAAALKESTFSEGAGASLTGMVKQSDQSNHVSFTQSGCEHWVEIPVEMIESAEHQGNHACGGHSHPVMKITLKASDNPAHKVLLALLSQSPASKSVLAAEAGAVRDPMQASAAFASGMNPAAGGQVPVSSYAARVPGTAGTVGPGTLGPGTINPGIFSCTFKNCVWGCKKIDLPFGRWIWWCDFWCDMECTIGF